MAELPAELRPLLNRDHPEQPVATGMVRFMWETADGRWQPVYMVIPVGFRLPQEVGNESQLRPV